MKRKELGAYGEALAAQFLLKQGYKVRERGYRCPEGEIDIVAEQGEFLVFVEVKSRSSDAFGTPEESITATKRRHLTATALHYLATHSNLPPSWRIDVVALELGPGGKVERIALVENAVTE